MLDDFDDTVEPLGYCIGESRTDKGQDLGKVASEGAGILSRSGGGVPVKEPSQTFERLPLVSTGFAPLLLAHIIEGAVSSWRDGDRFQCPRRRTSG